MADEGLIHAEVLTPEGKVFEGALYQVSARTVVGEVGIRSRHAPMLARLVPSDLRLYESASDFSNGNGQHWAAAEGWMEVFADKVVVLIEEAHEPSSLDAADLKSRIEDAQTRLSAAEDGSATEDVAKRDLQRAEAFLATIES